MNQIITPEAINHSLGLPTLSETYSPLRAVAIDVRNAERYANQLAEIYSSSVHTALMEHDPKAAVRIATLFAELCSTTGRADMRIARLSNRFAQGGAL